MPTAPCGVSHSGAPAPACPRDGASGFSPARTTTSAARGGLSPRTDATRRLASGSSEDDNIAASDCSSRLAGGGRSPGGAAAGRPGRASSPQDFFSATGFLLPPCVPSPPQITILCRPPILSTVQ